MKPIDNYSFSGKKAIIRVDFNVPLNDQFEITDDVRIRAALPTIKKVLNDNGAAILMSHLGRPKGGYDKRFSLTHIVNHLSQLLDVPVKFSKDCIGNDAAIQCNQLLPGEVLLLENLRFHKEEKQGDMEFSKALAALGDVYINDAFGTAHRAHASTAVIAGFFPKNKFLGYLIERELDNIAKVMTGAKRPITAVLGGAKISGKIEIIQSLMEKVDNLIIGGGMVFTFIKAMGGEVGSSLVEDSSISVAQQILNQVAKTNTQLILPVDAVIADEFSDKAKTQVVEVDKIPAGWLGLDIGPRSIQSFQSVISKSKTVFWNGPMGVFEMEPFKAGTLQVADQIAKETEESGLYSLIGGGDSVSAINQFGLGEKVSYISTGGGALLEYLEGKVLPGIAAINN